MLARVVGRSPRAGEIPATNAPAAAEQLHERDGERRVLQDALGRARRGAGSLVVVEGPAGIGKTRLLSLAAALARGAGIDVAATRALEREQGVPWAVAGGLLTGPVRAAPGDERARLLAGQAALAAGIVDPSAPRSEDRHAVVRGLYWLAVHLTSGTPVRPLLLSVDDVQWADPASAAFLAHLAARVQDLPIAVVLAVRTGEDGAGEDVLDWVREHPERQVLVPAALSMAGIGTVVADELGTAAPEFVQACARVTGGNPFLLTELARTLGATGTPPTAGSVPDVEGLVPASVLEAVLTRLRRLGEPARRIAAAAAVLGDGAVLHRVARLAQVEPATAEQAADALAAGHVLEPGEPLRFAHPLIARAVYADLPSFARAAAHRAAAELLAEDGRPGVEVAAHLLPSRPDGRAPTVRTLREAAHVVLSQGDPGTAVRMLRRALAEPPQAPERPGLLLQLAAAQVGCNDAGAEDSIQAALALATDAGTRAAAHTALARARFARSDHLGAAQAFDLVLADLGPEHPSYERILGQYLTAATLQVALRGRTEALLAPVIAAAAAGRLPEDPGLLTQLALRTALAGGPAAQVRALAERATRDDPLVDGDLQGTAMGMLVHALVTADDIDAAERIANAALAEAQRRGSVLMFANASYHRALCRTRRGALTPALDDLEQALRASRESRPGGVVWVQSLTARVHLERGDGAAATTALRVAGTTSPQRLDHAFLLAARAQVALAAGDPSTALRAACDAGEHLGSFGIDHPGFMAWRPVAARAAQALGDGARAVELAEEELERCRAHGVPSALSRALRTVVAVRGGAGGVEALHEAEAIVGDGPCALERAYVLVALGTALHRGGDRGAAQSRLRDALQLADACGAAALAKEARDALRATGARPRRAAQRGSAALTPSERRIAELAASGLTNIRIAQDLFVTPKTVETHLTNVFRKLGVGSRRELAAALSAPAADPVVSPPPGG